MLLLGDDDGQDVVPQIRARLLPVDQPLAALRAPGGEEVDDELSPPQVRQRQVVVEPLDRRTLNRERGLEGIALALR